jgi:hypothetical protein
VSDHRWTRPRLLLALLLAALVAGAVPIRAPASRRDKASGTAAWRAASVRPQAPRPDAGPGGDVPLASAAPSPLPAATLLRVRAARPPRTPHPAPAAARSPLPRAPPVA